MMAGSLIWNLLAATFGFFFAFSVSWTANTWQTSIMRGAKYFLVFFAITFLFRISWSIVRGRSSKAQQAQEAEPANQSGRQQETSHEENHTEEELEGTTSQDVSAKETSEMIRSLLNEDESK